MGLLSGVRPGIAILGWPIDKLPAETARQVLEGARAICAEAGYSPGEIDALHESGAVAGPAADTVQSSFMA